MRKGTSFQATNGYFCWLSARTAAPLSLTHTSFIHPCNTYIHTYVRTYIHTYIGNTYVHSFIRSYIHTCIHVKVKAVLATCVFSQVQPYHFCGQFTENGANIAMFCVCSGYVRSCLLCVSIILTFFSAALYFIPDPVTVDRLLT